MTVERQGGPVNQEAIDRVVRELDARYPDAGWQVAVHRSVDDGQLRVVASGPAELDLELHKVTARGVSDLHTAVVAEASVVSPGSGLPVGRLPSCIGVPVFEPDVFDPDPKGRPLAAVVTFASRLQVTDVIRDGGLHSSVRRLADGLMSVPARLA